MSATQKIALITGANKGIGFEAVRQLASKSDQYLVLLAARNAVYGAQAVESLKKQGLENVRFIELDVTNEKSVEEAAKQITIQYGRLDILVNNAGVIEQSGLKAFELTATALNNCLATNLDGVIRTTTALIPLLRKAGKARIINVSSTFGSLDFVSKNGGTYPSYHISKAALNMYTVLLANELKGSGITANVICPGWVATDMGGPQAPRTVEQGAAIITKLATQEEDVTGAYLDDNGTIAW